MRCGDESLAAAARHITVWRNGCASLQLAIGRRGRAPPVAFPAEVLASDRVALLRSRRAADPPPQP